MPPEEDVPLVVGGVHANVKVVSEAHRILEDSPGLMVRQPLLRYSNILATCDYHREAAPYRDLYYTSLTCTGRGAAGRPATKHAFMHALRVRSWHAMREAPLELARPLAEEAYLAIAEDVSYVLSMVKMAVSIQVRQHVWRLRSELRQAQQAATADCQAHDGEWQCTASTACGTGQCRLAQGVFTRITAVVGPGKAQRPSNHVQGGTYGTESAAAQLEQLMPFTVETVLLTIVTV